MELSLCLSLYLSLLACGMFEYVCRKHNEMRGTIRANPCLILCLLVVASLRGIQCKWLSCLGKTVETSSPLSGRLFNAAFVSVQFFKYVLDLKLVIQMTNVTLIEYE